MSNCQDEAEAAMQSSNVSSLSAQDILQRAFDKTDVEGSSTACVIVINGNTISASNLGDSGFVLLRNKVVVFQSPQQQHNFNFPFQLGSREGLSDQPQAAMVSWLLMALNLIPCASHDTPQSAMVSGSVRKAGRQHTLAWLNPVYSELYSLIMFYL